MARTEHQGPNRSIIQDQGREYDDISSALESMKSKFIESEKKQKEFKSFYVQWRQYAHEIEGQLDHKNSSRRIADQQRDFALQDRDAALKEKQTALRARDMAIRDLRTVVQDSNKERQSMEAVSQDREAELQKVRKQLEKQISINKATEQERNKLALELENCKKALGHAQKDHQDTNELLSRRTIELDAAQTFLETPELVSEAVTVELAQALNYEIAQIATALAESYEEILPRKPPQAVIGSIHPVSLNFLNASGAMSVLQNLRASDPVTSLQIGLQGYLAFLAVKYIQAWAFTAPDIFTETLDALRHEESELVAIRWSALSHKYALKGVDGGFSEKELACRLIALLGDAIAIAGFQDSETPRDREQAVYDRTEQKALEIAHLIVQLNEVVGQKIANGWVECFGFGRSTRFDPARMEVAFRCEDEGRADDGESRVMCTTAMGLRRVTKDDQSILLKPMVALDTFFEA